jgi:hypothetical protein
MVWVEKRVSPLRCCAASVEMTVWAEWKKAIRVLVASAILQQAPWHIAKGLAVGRCYDVRDLLADELGEEKCWSRETG